MSRATDIQKPFMNYKIVQQLKMPAAKPENLSSLSQPHTVEGEH